MMLAFTVVMGLSLGVFALIEWNDPKPPRWVVNVKKWLKGA